MWFNNLICLTYGLPVLDCQAESVLRRRHPAYRRRLKLLCKVWCGALSGMLLFPDPAWGLSVFMFTAFVSFSILDESVSS
ncbi:MAG: hypothetical protein D6758_03165 [Gammaproteobacteria bacterium]|nr:MAG: hypothetical protein D6758_03165 [Gammaproteobacteria bacterium]